MPIIGLSDNNGRLPRLGKIRLGEKSISERTGKEYPTAVDYFVCPPEVQEVYGEKPRELDIMFPHEDRDVFFPQWYKRYGSGSGLVCKGDGQTATMVAADGEMVEIECNPTECEWSAKKHCRPIGNLLFLLPRVPGLGIYQLDTSSYNSILNVNGGIEFIRGITGGRIAMLPLKLRVIPREVAPEGKKKTVWVLELTNDKVRLQDLLLAARKTPAEYLLPEFDEHEAPEDLYPRSLLEAGKPQTPPSVAEPEDYELPETDPFTTTLEQEARQLMSQLGWSDAKQTLYLHKYKDQLERFVAGLKQKVAEMDQIAETSPSAKADQKAQGRLF